MFYRGASVGTSAVRADAMCVCADAEWEFADADWSVNGCEVANPTAV